MKLFEASILSDIHWRIRRSNPVQQEMHSLPGFFFVNPLIYPLINSSNVESRIVAVTSNQAIVKTSGILLATSLETLHLDSLPLVFEVQKGIDLNPKDASSNSIFVVISYVEHLISSLRLTSRQVDISRSILSCKWLDCESLPDISFPSANPNQEVFLNGFIWDTASTWQNLVDADANLSSRKVPVYEELIIDAIHAYRSRDYRRALLYSAISMEAGSATKLDEIANSKGAKDPVFKLLSKRSRFAQRLHEIPLYLTGKSLLVENEPLYQIATKVYRTRNKIAHLGEVPEGEQSYVELNEDGARMAIACAIKVIQWLGEHADFPPLEIRFVKLQAPQWEIQNDG